MKISRLEIAGFRGIRDHVQIWLPSGFAVIVGRNGAGKSTVCDAIEYALTGEITRHRAGSEKGESIEQYLWWRGANPPEQRFVSLALTGEDGSEHVITRRPDAKEPIALRDLAPLLCKAEIDPTKKMADVCVGSIIRDERITELSVDMTEAERFEFVRRAVGSANFAQMESKLTALQKALESQIANAGQEYERSRERVVQVVAELSRIRSQSPIEREAQATEGRLRSQLGGPAGEPRQLLVEAQRELSRLRVRVERGTQILHRVQARLRSGAPDSNSNLENEHSQIELKLRNAQAELNALRQAADEARMFAKALEAESHASSSLAELHLHGSQLGLMNGRCPLCGSLISQEEFAHHLDVIRRGLEEAAVRLAEARSRAAAAEEEQRKKSQLVDELGGAAARVEASLEEARAFREQITSGLAGLSLEPISSEWDTQPLALWLDLQGRRIRELEASMISFEATLQLSRALDLEKELDEARKVSQTAEKKLDEARRAANRAKSAADTLRRISGEIVDERLAAISPLLDELYSRLKPHIDWPEISYLLRGDVRRLLSLRVGAGLNLRYMFSSGQRRAAGLAFLLAVSLSRPWCGFRTLVLDDPVQHIDDYRALHLVETLSAVRRAGFQVVCTVEDAGLGDLLARRLRSTHGDAGALVEMGYQAGEGGRVLRQRPIIPFPAEVLLSA